MTALFYDDIIAFEEMMYQQRSAKTEKEMKRKKREVGQAKRRVKELENALIERKKTIQPL